ncbi:uncharacterized protein LOC131009730 [Salvia miltiorrhiza]|uniref:uncharacterized protein LOC131009730 n=1 Tax=Salvia miltiorrhiza TaxID=226208 RepID=UPI0025AD0A41|nr:uncharacterized protein LOC131009730 [Salvia miltiorrhiza]
MSNYLPFLTLRQDATGRNGLSSLQKCTAAIRQLAYAAPGDSLDEYMWMGESTALKCLHEICRSMITVYGDRYLRTPNAAVLNACYKCMKKDMASRECWEVSIACIGSGGMAGCITNDTIGFHSSRVTRTRDPVRRKFAQRQEAARKDVERAFRVLQARWAVVRNPARSYFKETFLI